ncbi:MAG: hypothetical protein ACR2G7_10535 [Acidimicrobiales bacterium]
MRRRSSSHPAGSGWRRVPEDVFDAHVEKVVEAGQELTTAGLLRSVSSWLATAFLMFGGRPVTS